MSVINAKLAPAEGLSGDSIQKFTLKSRPSHILLSLPDGTNFGYLRDNLTKALAPLLGEQGLDLEAVAMTWRLRERIGKADKSAEAIVQVNINVYGPRDKAESVGDGLSTHKQWLQKPDYFKSQFPYENPHLIQFPGFEPALQHEQVRKEAAPQAPRAHEDRLHQIVSEVHERLQRANDLGLVTGDRRLKTELLR